MGMFRGKAVFGLMATLVLSSLAGASGPASQAGHQAVQGTKFQFTENIGQWNSQARFLGRVPGMDIWVTNQGVVYDLYKLTEVPRQGRVPKPLEKVPNYRRSGHVIGMNFIGSSANSGAQGSQNLPSKFNYILNGKVHSGAEAYRETSIQGLYPGIDARIYFDNGRSRFDLIVKPGADPSQIQTNFPGARGVSVSKDNKLVLGTQFGDLKVDGLYAYQQVGATMRPVQIRFKADKRGVVRYQIGDYDETKPLVIDPVVYSTLLGVAGGSEAVNDVAADNLGFAYVAGTTTSGSFPTTFGAYDEFFGGGTDSFVTKMSQDAQTIVWSTLIGGNGADVINGLAIDGTGAVYVGGLTQGTRQAAPPNNNIANDLIPVGSTGFVTVQPGTGAGFATLFAGGPGLWDGFVFKLSPDGSTAVYASYLGGTAADYVNDVALDSQGQLAVVGYTDSPSGSATPFPTLNFLPTMNTYKGTGSIQNADPLDDPNAGDGFVLKLNAAGTGLIFSSYLGGSGYDESIATGVDLTTDQVFVAGNTQSPGVPPGPTGVGAFPTTVGAFDRTVNGLDAFVSRINAGGSTYVFSTILGGSASEVVGGLSIDAAGAAHVAGNTNSNNFPRTAVAYDTTYNQGTDSYLTKFNQNGSALIFSTFMGTAGGTINGVAVDNQNITYVVGTAPAQIFTASPDALQANYAGPPGPVPPPGDAFVLAFNEAGTARLYASYFGGTTTDTGNCIFVDESRNVYFGGQTNSIITDARPFPTTAGVFKEFMVLDLLTPPALPDGFLIKNKIIVPTSLASITIINPASAIVCDDEGATLRVQLTAPASVGGAIVNLSSNNPVASVPNSVTIPQGQTFIDVPVTTQEVDSTRAVQLTASVEGDIRTTLLTVTPWLKILTLGNTTVVGGNSVLGRVTLEKVTPVDRVVNLFSNNAVAPVPATVTVPAGSNTATFPINTFGVAATTVPPVAITATHNSASKSQNLEVTPAVLTSLTFFPNRVSGGAPAVCRVTLNGKVPVNTDIIVDAFPSVVPDIDLDPATAGVQTTRTVTILANSPVTEGRYVEFTVNAPTVAAGTSRTLRARRAATLTEPVTGTLFIDATDIQSISIDLAGNAPYTVSGGTVVTGRVNLNRPAAPGGLPLIVSLTPPTGIATIQAGAQVPGPTTNVLVPAGASASETFTIRTNVIATTTALTVTAARADGSPGTATVIINVTGRTMSLALNPTTVVGGAQNSTGTVTISTPAPAGGLTVALASSNTAAATVPATVLIPAGSTTANFTVTTTAVANSGPVTITATLGALTANAVLNVNTPGVVSLTLNPSALTGGATSTGTVTLNGAAPVGGAVVNLTTSNASVAVPAVSSITIPAGQTTRTFTVNTFPQTQDRTATITATRGPTSASASLLVRSPRLQTLVFKPTTIRVGQQTTGTLTLDQPAPTGGLIIELTNNIQNVLTIPTTVTIPAGSRTTTFKGTARQVSRPIQVTVTAKIRNSTLTVQGKVTINR